MKRTETCCRLAWDDVAEGPAKSGLALMRVAGPGNQYMSPWRRLASIARWT